ncbi:peptidase M23 [Kitasatospora sp. NPDC057692]|uniref:peptidase M23 n=1 Tax=Kitasatospora sp. NPDC057692 TaxID=3346215 RepID=UPI00367CDCBF
MTNTLRALARPLRRAVPAGVFAAAAALPLLAPAGAHATTSSTQVYVWATDVNVRACAGVSASCPPIGLAQIGQRWVTAFCQVRSTEVVDGPYYNNWWVKVDAGGPVGWISAVYVRGGDNDQPVPGVSTSGIDC